MLNYNDIYNECVFKAVRSSGSGGQHVNKVATKIEVYFNVKDSLVLSDNQKEKILDKLENKLSKLSELIITAQDTRSQFKNKQLAFAKLLDLLNSALAKVKKRKPTQVPIAVKIKRLKLKRSKSDIKKSRQKPRLDS
ncbi:alternative ribosome rescue aminoacyl-tRNA hydrolase ArfB [Aurantibacter aestuarii]|uniref:Aminoacyl-tRNA hydrolase n=1 Tax=Aurantibacter aestuarii TaxID=1266046 RepID=A0A2T1NCC2_9FLAO|nr:alternative ribosome rescue aminoacyl-tRNA hydrolase ArfB [Aurantibacter aestuarii]PSG90074.1 aminoacyl-tRNA hydrolase [Aurantibacter aestuarii]